MESVNTEVEEAAAVVLTQEAEPKVEAKGERKEVKESSLRQSLKKNLKEADFIERDNAPQQNGTQTEPAQNKSFVNGENQQQVAKPVDPILPPKGMTEEERKTWDTLTPEGKKFLARRGYETDATFNRRMSELSAREKEVADLSSAVSPEVREEYTRQGIAIPDLVRRSIAWDKRVKEGIDGAFEFLEAHGYKAEDLVNYKGQQQDAPQYLTKEEAERLAEETFQKKLDLHQQSSIAETNANALQSFLDSKPVFKGDPGTAAQVENAVAEEIEYLKFKQFQGSTSQLLEQAYQRAIANNPAFSGLAPSPVSQQAAPSPKQEDIYQQMERVRAAKAASKSASGSLGSGSPQHKSNSIRESLERNAAKYSG